MNKICLMLIALIAIVSITSAYCPGESDEPGSVCYMIPPVSYIQNLSAGFLARGTNHGSTCFRFDNVESPNFNRPTTCGTVTISPAGSASVSGQCGCYVCLLASDTYYGSSPVYANSTIYSVSGNTTANPQIVSMHFESVYNQGGSGSNPPTSCVSMPNQ